MVTEEDRDTRLLAAQASAVALFDEVVARGLVAAGQGEQAVSDRIRDGRRPTRLTGLPAPRPGSGRACASLTS